MSKCTCTIRSVPFKNKEEDCPWHRETTNFFGMDIIVDPKLPNSIILLKGEETIEVDVRTHSIKILQKPTN